MSWQCEVLKVTMCHSFMCMLLKFLLLTFDLAKQKGHTMKERAVLFSCIYPLGPANLSDHFMAKSVLFEPCTLMSIYPNDKRWLMYEYDMDFLM